LPHLVFFARQFFGVHADTGTEMKNPSSVARFCFLIAVSLLLAPAAAAETVAHELEGFASWYGGKFQGRLTASGEVFDTTKLTAAHKTLPFDTVVEVSHLGNGRTVQVRINDRGPFVEGRVIDLSRAAADALDMAGEGVAPVRLTIVSEPGEPTRSIQVGSFGLRSNAEDVGRRIVAAGIDAVTETGAQPTGEPVYRIVVPDVPESVLQDVLDELATIGFSSVLVRSR
jgi:peptidoglycan lytic transglycosylase